MPKNKGKGKKGGKSFQSRFIQSPGGLVKPLRGKRLRKEIKASTRLTFGPEQRQLAAEKRASQMQQRRIGDWFDEYQQAVRQQQGQVAQAYGSANQQVGQQAMSAANYSEQLRQRLRQEDEADAQLRGANYDPSMTYQATAANLARLNTANTFRGQLATQGANQSAYFTDKRRIAGGEKINQLLREAARGRSINADQRDLARRKGDYRHKLRMEARPQERDFYLGLLQARIGRQANKLDARVSQANSRRSARSSANSLRETRRHNQAMERNDRREESRMRAENRYERRHPNAGDSSSGSGNRDDRRNTRAAIKSYIDEHGKPKNRKQKAILLNDLPGGLGNRAMSRRILRRLLNKTRGRNRRGGPSRGT